VQKIKYLRGAKCKIIDILVRKIKSPGGAPAPPNWCTAPPLDEDIYPEISCFVIGFFFWA
jgi:hypothetical protein